MEFGVTGGIRKRWMERRQPQDGAQDAGGSADVGIFEPPVESILSDNSESAVSEERPPASGGISQFDDSPAPYPADKPSDLSVTMNRLVESTVTSMAFDSAGRFSMPWESASLGSIFKRSLPTDFLDDSLRHLLRGTRVGMADTLSHASTVSVPIFQQQSSSSSYANKRLKYMSLVSSEDDLRSKALSRFRTMVLMDPNATRLGRTLVNFAGFLEPAEVITRIFSDVFAPKSTGTLMKRSHSLWTFCKFLRSKQQGNPFCFMRSSNFGATAPSHFLEAMRFADAMLGFVQPLEITPRIKGAAHAQYVTKRRRKPARVLTLDMVKELERICIHGDLLRNRGPDGMTPCSLQQCRLPSMQTLCCWRPTHQGTRLP